ncbi:MAG: GNAT family N-acetyltransferase [Proteobacteria bacterium]|nr:GNAT family N-acetyltransferase [Pseudomonadota bacterium]
MNAESGLLLREPVPGDIGWVIHRHGILYTREYGWNINFEALIAEVAARFMRERDPERERCWIAELNGRRVGSIFLMRGEGDDARLRLLYVEPDARGHGVGRRLVNECVTTAREAGYETLTLWTTNVLAAARHLYEEAGFTLQSEESFDTFGPRLVGQYWQLPLRSE